MIQITEGDWVFTLANGRTLTISGQGITKVYRMNDITPDQLQGFALGWVAYNKMIRAESDLLEEKYPVYAPM